MNDKEFSELFQILRKLAEFQDGETEARRHTNARHIGDAITALYGVKPAAHPPLTKPAPAPV
mgnify:CR=1 FL=1